MRLGSYSRFGWVMVLSSLLLAPVIYSSFAYANPMIVGLARLFAGVIGRRALTLEAEEVAEGVYVASMERATAQSLAATVRARMANVAANSSLRVKGAGTWGTLALSSGIMSLSDLQSGFQSGTLSFKTDGVALGNGKYRVNLGNGETKIVDFNPSSQSPVFVYRPESVATSDVKPIIGVETGYSVPDNALFSIKDTKTNTYYFGQKSPDVAVSLAKVDMLRRYPDHVLTAKGDNTTFEYTDRSYTLDIHFLATAEEGSTYPEGVLGYEGVGGIPLYYVETVEAKIKTHKLRSDFEVCKDIDVTEIQNNKPVTLTKYYCEPPKSSDYTITESHETEQYFVDTNHKYKPLTDKILVGTLGDVLSKANLKTKLNDAIVVKLLNNLLMEAATKEDYQGVPFTSSKSITVKELASLLKDMNLSITYDDLFREASTDASSFVINKTDVDVDIDNETDINLGENPNIASPKLDDPPTGKKILNPIIKLMPFVNNINIAAKEVQCPVWKFELWDKQYSVNSHCILLEKIRVLLKAVFLLIWGLVSLRIMLTA